MMKMLRANEVMERVGVSRTTIWRLERRGEFPPRRRITNHIVAWSEDEIEEWLKSRQPVGEQADNA